MTLLQKYRATGADVLFGDPRAAHPGVAMEGYFWHLTEQESNRSLIALCGVNQGPEGPWATVGLAAWPAGFVRTAAVDGSFADPQRLGVRAGGATPVFAGDAERLLVDLGEDARLDVRFDALAQWPRRSLGGSSVFQMVPGLNQYWHPWLLGGRASGTAIVGDETWHFDNAQVYGEKNWGREGFPESWWWGQAQGFREQQACVAFAGGIVTTGPLRVEVTGLVVRLPDRRVIRLGDPGVNPVRARMSDETWSLRGTGFGWKIDVWGEAPIGDAFVLPVPLPSERRNMPGDLEHLAGTLSVRVRRFGTTVWQGTSRLAALEHGGLDRARAELQRRGLDDTTESAGPHAG